MIQLDLNNPEFQANLFALNKQDAWAVLKTLRLLQAMTWDQIQASKGQRVNGSTRCASRAAAGPWPGALGLPGSWQGPQPLLIERIDGLKF